MSCALRFHFKATNNQAKYEELLAGLHLAKEVYGQHLVIFSDFQLIINQINSKYQAKGEKMTAYLKKVQELLGQFNIAIITQVPRSKIFDTDALAWLGTSFKENFLKTMPIEILETPSIVKWIWWPK